MGNSVILIGPRGSGKTTTGKILSKIMNTPFVDADERFMIRYGEIKDYVERYDWETFRQTETEIIREICSESQQIVLAPGGGAVAHNQGEKYRLENIKLLKGHGKLVYLLPSQTLEESARILVAHINADQSSNSTRPSLTGNLDGLAEMMSVLQIRHPFYLASSDMQIYFGEKNQEQIAREIYQRLQ